MSMNDDADLRSRLETLDQVLAVYGLHRAQLPGSRSGQPWHRIERLQHIVGWFDHWLMGVPKSEYEIASEEEVPVKPRQAEKPPK